MRADKESLMDPEEAIALAAEVFSLLADPTRIRIVTLLHERQEMSVGALAEATGKAPSGISQHLARLRLARLVASRRDGVSMLYRLVDEHPYALVREALHQAEHSVAVDGRPPHHHAEPAPNRTPALGAGERPEG